jgi:uncharacterized membrane protein (UPF0127 family)
MHLRLAVVLLGILSLGGCGERPTTLDEFNTRLLVLPGGQKIRAEVVVTPENMMNGLKYRDSLAPDRGMLFIHGQMGTWLYWMYEVRIPLDLIWMDAQGVIVEMFPDAKPCPGPKEKCLAYGGHQPSIHVLEMAAGSIARYKLAVGQKVEL